MEGEGRIGYPLSQKELIFDDRVDVLPAHCLVYVEKGITGRNVQRAKDEEF